MPALAMGAAAGLVCFLACTAMKNKLGYDDSLDAFGVHGVGGALGALLTGVFATNAVNAIAGPEGEGPRNPVGAIDGSMSLLVGQAVAIAVTVVFAAVATWILLKILDMTMGLRVPQEEEMQGLDLSQHGEEGYIFL
jgi:Amt family ammonium transporter